MKNNSVCFFDFDNTLYKGKSRYLILDFPEFLSLRGFFDNKDVRKLQDLKILYSNQAIARDEFAIRVIESYYHGLSGQKENEILDQAHNFWKTNPEEMWFSYTMPLLSLMKRYTTTILVSGSPKEILHLIYKKIGIEELYGTQGIIEHGIYTGEFNTYEEMATYDAKSNFVKNMYDSYKFDRATSFAYGDSESDFPLLGAVNPRNSYLISSNKDWGYSVNETWNFVERDGLFLESVKKRLADIFEISKIPRAE